MREPIFKAITDERILIVVAGMALLWRTVVSLDEAEAVWESVCSGISLFLIGWVLFSYMRSMSLKPTHWPVSNKIYHGIAVSLLALNIYVAIYYGMRWFRLLHEEVYVPLDYVFRDVRYVMLVLCYCAVIWSAGHLRGMHDDYRLLIKEREKKRHATSMKEALFSVMTHERTLITIVIAAILWRIAISVDKNITFWESTCSCISLIIMGWFLFGYIIALSVKVKGKLELTKVIQGIALALCAINVYAILYYGMRWYVLLMSMEDVTGTYLPLDFLFRDIRYVMLVLFYCTAIVLAKYLEKAYEDYTVPSQKG